MIDQEKRDMVIREVSIAFANDRIDKELSEAPEHIQIAYGYKKIDKPELVCIDRYEQMD